MPIMYNNLTLGVLCQQLHLAICVTSVSYTNIQKSIPFHFCKYRNSVATTNTYVGGNLVILKIAFSQHSLVNIHLIQIMTCKSDFTINKRTARNEKFKCNNDKVYLCRYTKVL